MIRATTSASDLSPLRTRMGGLFALRLVLAISVLLTVMVVPQTLAAPTAMVMNLVASFLVLTVSLEVLRQWRGTLPTWLTGAAVLADGVFIAMALTLAGGPASSLSFLLYVHLVAVTLLASYRTGLKVAVWQSLLLVVTYYLPASMTGTAPLSATAAGSAIVAFLGVAVTTALCSALNERALRRSRSGFKALADMACQLEDVHNPDEVVAVLLHTVPQTFDVGRVALVLHDPVTLTVLANDRLETNERPAADHVDGVIAQCWSDRRPVLRKALSPDHDPELSAALPDARNLIVLPFTADGEATGALVVEHRRGTSASVGAAAVALLSQFTVHAALAHRNVRLMAEVKHLATVDGLTGLTNRRTFEAALAREVARSVRTGEDLSLLLIDVDHFKRVNDDHGHPMGDEVLRHVGRVLSVRGREFDLPARYGGEEFVVILPGCSADEAIRVAERLRAGIASEDAPLPVTASIGLAAMHRDASDARGLVKAADTALYEAKASGRDRTVAAQPRLRKVVA